MWYIWIGIIVLLFLIEYTSSKTIWFIISGIVTLFVSFIIDHFLFQFLLFLFGGLFLLTNYKEEVDLLEKKVYQKITPKSIQKKREKGKKRNAKSKKHH